MNVDASHELVARTHLQNAEDVADLRHLCHFNVLVDGNDLWLRGDVGEGNVTGRIRSIPDAELFEVQSGQHLIRSGETVPCARLPDGEWQPIEQWIELQLPSPGFAAVLRDKLALKLVRSTRPTEANILETNWNSWFEYVISAPQIRLSRLGYALSDQDRVLVRGTPLPPINGRRHFESYGVILPTGWRFEPDIGPIVARQILRLADDELALFADDGSYERILQTVFVQATRSSVRGRRG